MTGSGDWLLYDDMCPFCRNYIAMLRVREVSPEFKVLDARQHPALCKEMLEKGMNIDDGMIMHWRGKYYYDADCIQMLNLIIETPTIFGKASRAVFRSPFLSRHLYPVMKAGRNLTLRILGRDRVIDHLTLEH